MGSGGLKPYLWDATNGWRDLRGMLVIDLGLDLTGWTLNSGRSISADGLTIVGDGLNPSGLSESWITTIPEPSTGGGCCT
jgi:hypothetical protein